MVNVRQKNEKENKLLLSRIMMLLRQLSYAVIVQSAWKCEH